MQPSGLRGWPFYPVFLAYTLIVQNAGRLKYADPRDLPSYPSTGLRPDGAAAGAAASLGWQNKKTIEPWRPEKPSTASGTAATLGWNNTKTVEPWKPDRTSSASAAAALAKNYKMAPSWEPKSTSASSRAALLAAGSAGSANKASVPRTTTHDNWGSSAATQAFNADRSNSMRSGHYTTTPVSTQGPKSLAAAKGAMSGTRPRSTSTPTTPPAKESYPGESMAASNALSGATLAHRASTKPKPLAENAGAVPITTMTRNMFTSNPPVKPEVDEQQNNEKLHASAVAMARQMYLQQQKMADQAKTAQDQNTEGPKPYVNLQDAAYKQAQERLAKLYEEHEKNRSMQEYYGNAPAPRRRFSLTSKLRRRASSDGDLEDRQQSEKIRREMSMFSDKLSQVDENKRQKDRDAVLAAAQRNVKAQLQGMDQKVYNETGKVNPTMLSSWEVKAKQIAEVNHESRNQNKGKIDIGGGKFMDPSEVNAIAAKRVQPVLEDINTKAENERERQAAIKMEEEAKQAEVERHKVREREVKEIHQKLKGTYHINNL